MTNSPSIPRHQGGQAPDILGMKVAHRAMRGDLRRLAALMQDVAAGRTTCDARRARAITWYTDRLAESIHHHHRTEDDVLWPVIEQRAGSLIDLTELTDDHSVLDPELDRLRAAALALQADPASQERAAALALQFAELRDLLDEHITEEEADVFPVILEYLSVDDWTRVERSAQRSGRLSFELPRALDHASTEELEVFRAEGGAVLVVLAAIIRPLYRRKEKLVFG